MLFCYCWAAALGGGLRHYHVIVLECTMCHNVPVCVCLAEGTFYQLYIITNTTITRRMHFNVECDHGRPQGGGQGGGTCPPPLEFEKMTSYAAVLQNTLELSLAPSALALDTLYFGRKTLRKNAKMFVCAIGAPKNGRFFVRRAENVSTF